MLARTPDIQTYKVLLDMKKQLRGYPTLGTERERRKKKETEAVLQKNQSCITLTQIVYS